MESTFLDKVPDVSSLMYSVTLSRQMDEPFGFALRGTNIGLIHENSPADKIGSLKVGDDLLSINNKTVSGLSNRDIVSRVNDSGQSINLTLRRPEKEYSVTLFTPGNKYVWKKWIVSTDHVIVARE